MLYRKAKIFRECYEILLSKTKKKENKKNSVLLIDNVFTRLIMRYYSDVHLAETRKTGAQENFIKVERLRGRESER